MPLQSKAKEILLFSAKSSLLICKAKTNDFLITILFNLTFVGNPLLVVYFYSLKCLVQ